MSSVIVVPKNVKFEAVQNLDADHPTAQVGDWIVDGAVHTPAEFHERFNIVGAKLKTKAAK